MRIGIALDETIPALPAWFALLTKAVVAGGHEMHVITAREPGTETEVMAELDEFGIGYTALHVPSTAVDPPAWKAKIAGELKLDVMIEDSPEVLAKMPAGVARMWLSDPAVFDLDVCVEAMTNAPAPKVG